MQQRVQSSDSVGVLPPRPPVPTHTTWCCMVSFITCYLIVKNCILDCQELTENDTGE